MRKPLCLLTMLALAFAVDVFAQAPHVVYKEVPRTVSGQPFATIQGATFEPHGLANFKAQNHLSYAVNQNIKSAGLKVGNAGFINGPIDTVPYFQSWFITGSRNSVYPYSMVGHSPKAGGTTTINTQLIPLITVLLTGGSEVAVYDPTISNDPEGDDVSLVRQSPLFDATTTYPGPPSETGQFADGHQRVSFRASAAANWHTRLTPTSSGIVWIQFLESNNGDWAYACCDGHGNNFPVFNINTISNNFEFILGVEVPPNSTVPIIVTDFLTAFDPSNGGCCILGYHTAEPGKANPAGILAWTWATFIPHSASNPFGAFGEDTMVMSHEVDELVNDPFVNTAVAPWVDGSVSFAQANLETGDVIEAMSAGDVITTVPLITAGGPYTYSVQNVANLEWFTRTPFNGGIYSWPDTGTLSQAPHPVGCTLGFPCWTYGQGSGGFYFGPPY
jgi:hypothetical protein